MACLRTNETYLACTRVHPVDLKVGRIIGADDDKAVQFVAWASVRAG